MAPWWVAIVTFVGGSGVTLGVEWIRTLNSRADRQQAAIERREDRVAESSARSDERQAALAREHHGRQVATLEDLQFALSDYMRSCGEIEAFDRSQWRKAGCPSDTYPVSLLPEDLSEENNRLQRKVRVLAERVDDTTVRIGVRDLVNASTHMARSIEESTGLMTEAGNQFEGLNRRIGSAIREESKAQRSIGSDVSALGQGVGQPEIRRS